MPGSLANRDPISPLRNGLISINPIVGTTPSNATKLSMVESIIRGLFKGQSTISSGDLPMITSLMGVTIDWSAGTSNDVISNLAIGGLTASNFDPNA